MTCATSLCCTDDHLDAVLYITHSIALQIAFTESCSQNLWVPALSPNHCLVHLCRLTRTDELVKTYSCCLYPGSRLLQSAIGGAWTEDPRYFARGRQGGRDVLRLKHVWWLDLQATFKVCHFYLCTGLCHLNLSGSSAHMCWYLITTSKQYS